MTPVRVLVADDQRVIREGLMTLLGLLPEVVVVGEARDGRSAVELARAIADVAAGEMVLEAPVQARVLAAALEGAEPQPLPDELTPREAQVLALIAEGLSNGEIAERLTIGPATVKTHVHRIFGKTGVRDRPLAMTYAYRTGLARPPSG
jgi:DNA-binding NarL/FixJ family response regulator